MALGYAADDLVLALHQRQKRGTSEAGVKHDDDEGSAAGEIAASATAADVGCCASAGVCGLLSGLERDEFLTLTAIRWACRWERRWKRVSAARVAGAGRPPLVRAWFGHWAELGWICAPELESLLEIP